MRSPVRSAPIYLQVPAAAKRTERSRDKRVYKMYKQHTIIISCNMELLKSIVYVRQPVENFLSKITNNR